jgi:hypothetical protein
LPETAAFISVLPPLQKRAIRAALKHISENPSEGKMLKDELTGIRSYPVGSLRIVYEEKGRDLNVIAVDYRESIYEILANTVKGRGGLVRQRRVRYGSKASRRAR